jgi:hypothetical protein
MGYSYTDTPLLTPRLERRLAASLPGSTLLSSSLPGASFARDKVIEREPNQRCTLLRCFCHCRNSRNTPLAERVGNAEAHCGSRWVHRCQASFMAASAIVSYSGRWVSILR